MFITLLARCLYDDLEHEKRFHIPSKSSNINVFLFEIKIIVSISSLI
jgi:hypothetical protein